MRDSEIKNTVNRPSNVWDKLRATLKAVGSFSLPLAQDVGADILRKLIFGD